ncbi:MFS transporter [Sphaerisporangium sp. NBC_01403]|uniref:MFS transporter n=1 Tax=Sphaerisporangium sp. NBC_01403 TaxID=2903599 RepID=UPI00324EA3DC
MADSTLSLARAWRATRGHTDARRLVAVHVVDCVGNGVQFSTLVLYLNRQSGLSVWHIGLGLAVGGAFGLVSNLVAGRLSDRWGGRRLLAGLLIGLGAVFCLLPLVRSLGAFILFATVYSLLHFSCGAPFISLIGDAFGAQDRARGRAMIRSFGNAGMALGAGASAILLAAAPGSFLAASPFVNAGSFLLAGLMVARLRGGAVKRRPDAAPRTSGWHAAFERGMPSMIVTTSVLGLHSSLLAVGIPLWISVTGVVPPWSIPVLIGLNTVLVVAFQVAAAERSGVSFPTAVRGSRVAGVVGAAGCAVMAVSLWPGSTAVAAVILVAGFGLLTVTELLQNGAAFYLGLNLGPDDRRGEYASAFHLTQIIEGVLGPLVIGAVFAGGDGAAWLVFTAALLAAAALYRRVAGKVAHLDPAPRELAGVGGDAA